MRIAPFLTLLALPVALHADDGFLTYGGAPRLLSNHPSIRMARERVVLEIRPQGFHVDATFEFRNDGPACAVRMGFPDTTEPDEEDPGPGVKAEPSAALDHFVSWVDGKPVKTALERNTKEGSNWHTKTVVFRRGQTVRVRVAYVGDGGGATSEDAGGKYLREAAYVLHTGASWRGPIGYAEVVVRFPWKTLPGTIRLVDKRRIHAETAFNIKAWGKKPKGTVVWEGFARPTALGREMRFVRSEFEPGTKDDVHIYFGYGHKFPSI